MRTKLLAILVSALAIWGKAAAATVDDDFNDGVRAVQWSQLTDDSSLQLHEQAGRLEAISTGPSSPNTDALYLSDGPAGFRLSTSANFEIAVDYSFTGYGTAGTLGQALALVFGVGKEAEGFNSAAIGFGFATRNITIPGVGTFPVTGYGALAAHRTGDVQSEDAQLPLAPMTDTFVMSYNAANDDLVISIASLPTPIATLDNIVHGQWNADSLLVSLGARGNGFTTSTGQAFLDNFVVRSGTVVPEPAALAIVSLLGITFRRTRVARVSH